MGVFHKPYHIVLTPCLPHCFTLHYLHNQYIRKKSCFTSFMCYHSVGHRAGMPRAQPRHLSYGFTILANEVYKSSSKRKKTPITEVACLIKMIEIWERMIEIKPPRAPINRSGGYFYWLLRIQKTLRSLTKNPTTSRLMIALVRAMRNFFKKK